MRDLLAEDPPGRRDPDTERVELALGRAGRDQPVLSDRGHGVGGGLEVLDHRRGEEPARSLAVLLRDRGRAADLPLQRPQDLGLLQVVGDPDHEGGPGRDARASSDGLEPGETALGSLDRVVGPISGPVAERVAEGIPGSVTGPAGSGDEAAPGVPDAAVGGPGEAVAEGLARLLPGLLGVVCHPLPGRVEVALRPAKGRAHLAVVEPDESHQLADGQRHGGPLTCCAQEARSAG